MKMAATNEHLDKKIETSKCQTHPNSYRFKEDA
jgi:hypothetical protein